MKVGVAGLGRMGALHARNLAADRRVGTLVVFDRDTSVGLSLSRESGATLSRSYQDLLEQVDAVVVATSTASHAPQVVAAVNAGKAVFCEKPLSTDLSAALAVAASVKEAHGKVMVGFQRRFDPRYRELRAMIRGGDLGTIYLIRANIHDPQPPSPRYRRTSGGILRDTQVHDFDLVRFLTGEEVQEVHATGSTLIDPSLAWLDDVDVSVVTARMHSGTQAVSTAVRHDPLGNDQRVEVFGSRDSVTLGLDHRTPLKCWPDWREPAAPYRDFVDHFSVAYRAEMHEFLDMCEGASTDVCTVDDGLEALKIAVACEDSRRLRASVRLAGIH